ncbi:hypothetical protein [Sedimenticola thiotaurini]|uniref:Uncharacterized protein n=1 Tax=Sedimenticola thiotaurini TaxID=1543721 RepID=A0A0F7K229_9GAMM|nr:hypothetical protein [Sedimenticola thiotaurini]AKH21604.1 hypothetical protein AAY24_15950 [Sedimenticola thiotaurini]
MGRVADFCEYKAKRDYDRQLLENGWAPTRLEAEAIGGTSIYIYDDHTRLLLYSVIQRTSLQQIIQRVEPAAGGDLLSLAEQLNALITDFSMHGPFQGDPRLSLMAQASAWFAGLSLSLINHRFLDDQSIAIFRLLDAENRESSFHLAHLAWPEIMSSADAEAQLSGMARSLRRDLIETV